MNSVDNMYLPGNKFEEKLSKIVTAKQKSKSLAYISRRNKVVLVMLIPLANSSATTSTNWYRANIPVCKSS